jgi:hypothetical protein
MITYEPPNRFVWATQLPRLGTNQSWELRLRPGQEAGTTSISMTLRLILGPLGWPTALIASARLRRKLETAAARALERACAVLEAESQIGSGRGKEIQSKRARRSKQRGSTRH